MLTDRSMFSLSRCDCYAAKNVRLYRHKATTIDHRQWLWVKVINQKRQQIWLCWQNRVGNICKKNRLRKKVVKRQRKGQNEWAAGDHRRLRRVSQLLQCRLVPERVSNICLFCSYSEVIQSQDIRQPFFACICGLGNNRSCRKIEFWQNFREFLNIYYWLTVWQ